MPKALALIAISLFAFAFALEGAVFAALAVPPRLEGRFAAAGGPAGPALACVPAIGHKC